MASWGAKLCRDCYLRSKARVCACGTPISKRKTKCAACTAAASAQLGKWRPRRAAPKPEPTTLVVHEPVKTKVRKCLGCGHTFTPGIMTCLRCDLATIPWQTTTYRERHIKVGAA